MAQRYRQCHTLSSDALNRLQRSSLLCSTCRVGRRRCFGLANDVTPFPESQVLRTYSTFEYVEHFRESSAAYYTRGATKIGRYGTPIPHLLIQRGNYNTQQSDRETLC
eukprot:scaffold1238_cov143-Amphora_coffeaeformis.AAC.3